MAPTTALLDTSKPAELVMLEFTQNPYSNDEIDRVVGEMVVAHQSGIYTEDEVRTTILAIVWSRGIHKEAIDRYGVPAAEREEIIGDVDVDLTNMFMKTDGTGYDIFRAPTSSVCAWTRKRATYTAMSKTRDARRAENRNGTPQDPTAPTFTSAASYEMEPLASTAVIDAHYQAIEDFASISQNRRGDKRIRDVAIHLYAAYGINLAVRPSDINERDAVYRALKADTTLAHRSLRAFNEIVHESDASAANGIDDAVLRLWDDLDANMIEDLMGGPAEFAHAVALDAVAPFARPSARNIQRYRAQVAEILKGDLQWRSLSSTLVASFVDREFQASSDFVSKTEEATEQTRKGAVVRRARYADLAGRAARYDGFPLGDTPAKVEASLIAIAMEHLGSDELARFAAQN